MQSCCKPYLTSRYLVGNFGELIPDLHGIRQKEGLSRETYALLFQVTYNLELLYYLNNALFEEALAIVPGLEDGLDQYAKLIEASSDLSYCYNISVVFLVMEQFSPGLKWVNRILGVKAGKERLDIQGLARIFSLVFHYELGNYDLVENQIRSARGFFRKK